MLHGNASEYYADYIVKTDYLINSIIVETKKLEAQIQPGLKAET
jgi:hypothetical protein